MTQQGQAPSYTRYAGGRWSAADFSLPREWPLEIALNGQYLVTLLCTPTKLNALVVGFLFLEGIVDSVDQIGWVRVCPDETRCEVQVPKPLHNGERRRVITSGCSGGTTFRVAADLAEVNSAARFSASRIAAAMKLLLQSAEGYATTGGVHTSALSDGEKLLAIAEDVGRHNTVDKVAGECLLRHVDTRDRLLLTTGRISSEMLLKAARLSVPVVVSRTSPTDLAVKLAQELGITLVGYVRGEAMNVYSRAERIG